jgi:hypothetical protein
MSIDESVIELRNLSMTPVNPSGDEPLPGEDDEPEGSEELIEEDDDEDEDDDEVDDEGDEDDTDSPE